MICEVPVELRETAAIARVDEAVRIGVPLPRGRVRNGAVVMTIDARARVRAAQWRALSLWPDGSVRWALVDFIATVAPCAVESVALRWEATPAAGAHGDAEAGVPGDGAVLSLRENDRGFRIDTGVAVFDLGGPRAASLLSAVTVRGQAMLGQDGVSLRLLSAAGESATAKIEVDACEVEDAGPVRATLAVSGRAYGAGLAQPLPFRARLAFVAGTAELAVELRLRNPRAAVHPGGLWDLGDPGSVRLRDLSLRIVPAEAAARLHWSTRPDAEPASHEAAEWRLYQDSSGGEHWDSPNHLGADGAPTVSFRGFRVTAGPAPQARQVDSGMRATPLLQACGEGGWIAAFVEDFWENFPRALRWVGGGIEIGFFPAEGRSPVELQGGEQKRHRAWLAFGRSGEGCRIARHHSPLEAWVDPAWIEATGALAHFTAPRPGDDPRLGSYLATLVAGPDSVDAGRERVDEYGWRNFGDAWADHEAVRHAGTEPFVSHYNNQYDLVHSAGMQALRERDVRWLRLMRDAARHVVDVDIYHTDEDKAAFNGGMFWHTDHHRPAALSTHRTYSRLNAGGAPYGGGPSSEHCYTSGLLLHHLLTGDPDAAEAVSGLADWIIAMDDGGRNLFGLLDDGPSGAASQTATPDYHGPGRGAGNALRALVDAHALTRRRPYLAKAEELLQRCIHPRDDVAARKLDEPELRWSYLVFLQALARYLDRKRELGEHDYFFHYARESLLRYAGWMLEHEVPYRDVLHKVAIPSETWPAHDLRKAEVLYEAAAWSGEASACIALRERADFFAARGVADVLSFDSARLLRPRVVVAGQADALRRFARVPPVARPVEPHAHDFGQPSVFVPQRSRIRATLASRWTSVRRDLRRELRSRWLAWRSRHGPKAGRGGGGT